MKKSQTQQVVDAVKQLFDSTSSNFITSQGMRALTPNYAAHVFRRALGQAEREGIMHWEGSVGLHGAYVKGPAKDWLKPGHKLSVEFADGDMGQHTSIYSLRGDIIDRHNAGVEVVGIVEVDENGKEVKAWACQWTLTQIAPLG